MDKSIKIQRDLVTVLFLEVHTRNSHVLPNDNNGTPGYDGLYLPAVQAQIVSPINYRHAENRKAIFIMNNSGLLQPETVRAAPPQPAHTQLQKPEAAEQLQEHSDYAHLPKGNMLQKKDFQACWKAQPALIFIPFGHVTCCLNPKHQKITCKILQKWLLPFAILTKRSWYVNIKGTVPNSTNKAAGELWTRNLWQTKQNRSTVFSCVCIQT